MEKIEDSPLKILAYGQPMYESKFQEAYRILKLTV